MSYTAGLMRDRVIVATKMPDIVGTFGRNSGGVRYKKAGTFWASVTFSKGMKSMREGAMDAYNTIMIRMRWNATVNRDCLLAHDGRCFTIQSLHKNHHENIVQITAVELPDKSTDFYETLAIEANGDILTADGQKLTITDKPNN